jgi:hypothetical protein
MKQVILYQDGKPSMLYMDDGCDCKKHEKEFKISKWLGTILTEILKEVIHTLFLFIKSKY